MAATGALGPRGVPRAHIRVGGLSHPTVLSPTHNRYPGEEKRRDCPDWWGPTLIGSVSLATA